METLNGLSLRDRLLLNANYVETLQYTYPPERRIPIDRAKLGSNVCLWYDSLRLVPRRSCSSDGCVRHGAEMV